MAPNSQHAYNVYFAHDITYRLYRVHIPNDPSVEVGDLAWKIMQDQLIGRALANEPFTLYKYSKPLEGSPEDFFKSVKAWLHSSTQRVPMFHAFSLNEYFPNGPSPVKKHIDVVIATDSFMESRDEVREILSSVDLSVKKAADIKGMKPPSESSSSPAWMESAIGGGHLRAHRPANNYGPHTSLFHHAFAEFKHRADHLDDDTVWQGDLEPSADLLDFCHSFITSSCKVYEDEKQRTAILNPFFEKVLPEAGNYQTVLGSGKGSAKVDATWGAWDVSPPYIIFREDKNEKGMGGNPAIQGAASYRVAISLDEYKPYIERSSCPAVIVAVMGTCIEIWSAVFIDGVFIDKLFSQEFYLDAFQAKSVLRLGRICSALKHCYLKLKQHYRMIDLKVVPSDEHLYPRPLPIEGFGVIPKLKYTGKLSHNGTCIPVVQEPDDDLEARRERPYAIYRAKLAKGDVEVEVVVKFTTRYNADAHNFLHGQGLAPELHYFSRLVGDHYMVVTDYVDSAPLSNCPKQENYLDILKQAERALDLLHGNDLVFGDLRPENILLDPRKGVKLIDFDFVGTHGVDRYPASFNTTIQPKGVERHGIMDKKHDIAMLSNLREFLEGANGSG